MRRLAKGLTAVGPADRPTEMTRECSRCHQTGKDWGWSVALKEGKKRTGRFDFCAPCCLAIFDSDPELKERTAESLKESINRWVDRKLESEKAKNDKQKGGENSRGLLETRVQLPRDKQ